MATFACSIGWGQRLHYGAIADFTTNDTYYKPVDESKPYVIGGFGQVQVSRSFHLTVDALYRRQGADSSKASLPLPPPSGVELDNFWVSRSRLNVWDFPILVKAYLTSDERSVRPFLTGGYVLRAVSKHSVRRTAFSQNPVTEEVDERGTFHGGALGAGVSFRVSSWLAIEPQYRYTRFTELPLAARSVHDILVGFRF